MRLLIPTVLCVMFAACGDDFVPGAGGPAAPELDMASGADLRPTADQAPDSAADGPDSPESTRDACEGLPAGGTSHTLPGAGTRYCLKAHPSCAQPGAKCPLYVTLNTRGAYFGRVDDPDTFGEFITVESLQPMDGDTAKDPLAELPRHIAQQLPGLDPERIYVIGWSAGAGGASRGMCHASKGYDKSQFGTTSDVYAALVTLGGCPSCSEGFKPISGAWHVFATNGMEDQFGGMGCEDNLRRLARQNGCTRAEQASWCAPGAQDALLSAAAPADAAIVEKLSFGDCPGGDVVGYRFHDEGHVVSYKAHFDPKISAYNLAWDFLQGRTKQQPGRRSDEVSCQ